MQAAQAAQDQQKPSYTIPEYNAFQAANAEKDPAAKIKLLDDFVGKFPSSTLPQYVYQLYYQAYLGMKNYPKAIEYADKLVAMGDKVDPAVVLGKPCKHVCKPFPQCSSTRKPPMPTIS